MLTYQNTFIDSTLCPCRALQMLIPEMSLCHRSCVVNMCEDVLAKHGREQKEELVIFWTPLDFIEETYSSDGLELLSLVTVTKPVMV